MLLLFKKGFFLSWKCSSSCNDAHSVLSVVILRASCLTSLYCLVHQHNEECSSSVPLLFFYFILNNKTLYEFTAVSQNMYKMLLWLAPHIILNILTSINFNCSEPPFTASHPRCPRLISVHPNTGKIRHSVSSYSFVLKS